MVGGGGTLGMTILVPDDDGNNERSYNSNTMLMVREKKP